MYLNPSSMLQPRLYRPTASPEACLAALASSLNALSLCSSHTRPPTQASIILSRHASHASQGRANGPKDSAGRRLGAKKTASEYVIPGNIIFKQRGASRKRECSALFLTNGETGTKWFPGENVGMGKDHTIYSLVPGYVRYYRDPLKHSKRRFIGVALEREGPKSQLPTPPNAPTRRRLGMYAAPIKGAPESSDFLKNHMSEGSILSGEEAAEILEEHEVSVRPSVPRTRRDRRAAAITRNAPPPPIMRSGGFRETNFSIGQRDRKGGRQLKDFDRSDRWTAWHKRSKKMKEKALARASRAAKKTKGKKTNKAAGARGAKRIK